MPRAGLDTEAVVAAAAGIADAEGLPAATIARLAASLGVRAPSLYEHVDGIDDLRRRIADRALRELASTLKDAAAGRARGDALAAMAAAYRAYALEHPGSYAAVQQAQDAMDASSSDAAGASADVVDCVAAVLRGYDLAGDDAIHGVRIVRATLHGLVARETAGGFALPLAVDDTFERLVAVLDAGLAAARATRS
jgi:AcrR family transcriptional regulator